MPQLELFTEEFYLFLLAIAAVLLGGFMLWRVR